MGAARLRIHLILSIASVALLHGLQALRRLLHSRALLGPTRAGIKWSTLSARRGISSV
jgi:hypothetical protein